MNLWISPGEIDDASYYNTDGGEDSTSESAAQYSTSENTAQGGTLKDSAQCGSTESSSQDDTIIELTGEVAYP